MKKRLTAQQKRYQERRRQHNRKHTLLRRECYKWLRKNMPDVYERLRKKAGVGQTGPAQRLNALGRGELHLLNGLRTTGINNDGISPTGRRHRGAEAVLTYD